MRLPAGSCIRFPLFIPAVAISVLATGNAALSADGVADLVMNPSFENGRNKPEKWNSVIYQGDAHLLICDVAHTGKRSVLIESCATDADAAFQTKLTVRPFSTYRLTGYVKTENIVKTTGQGALFNIHEIKSARTNALVGTNDWTPLEMTFKTDTHTLISLNCLFGGWGKAKGKAWFDDVNVQLVEAGPMPKPEVTIDGANTTHPVSPYIYGQFIEHLGRCIYGGIWAQMLEDRKFYYPVGHSPSPWVKVGGETGWSLTMDTRKRYVDRWSVEIQNDQDQQTPRGIAQEGIGLVNGKKYTGRTILAADDFNLAVEVTLKWGDQPDQKQTVTITGIDREFHEHPFEFTAGTTTDNATLSITTSQRGLFHIGTVALFPEDNVSGMRADTLRLLKLLNSPIYRWPGGNFVSGYDWRDGIGPQDRRPPRKNPAWSGVEHNDFGIDEFMDFCQILGTEPLVVVNTGEGSPKLAAELVEYCNGANTTEWGARRVQNGRLGSYNVKWWGVGNEMYGSWQLGHVSLEQYTARHNSFVRAMTRVDPNIKTVAVGNTGKWSERMLRDCANSMTALSEHFYVQEAPDVLAHTQLIVDQVIHKAVNHRKYQKEIPDAAAIPVALDEWNYWHKGPQIYGELGIRYYLRDALGIARGIHEMARNADVFLMANLAQTVNVIGAIKTTKTHAFFSTIALPLVLYRHHLGTIPIRTEGNSFPLDILPALTEDRKFLTLAVVNPLAERFTIAPKFTNLTLASSAACYLITATDPAAANTPELPEAVAIQEKQLDTFNPTQIEIPSLSVNLFKIPLK